MIFLLTKLLYGAYVILAYYNNKSLANVSCTVSANKGSAAYENVNHWKILD